MDNTTMDTTEADKKAKLEADTKAAEMKAADDKKKNAH
jgi:hypothetical protein